jgi:hypothetical protein
MKVFVDGDLIVYRAGFAAERTEYAVEYYDENYAEENCIWAENKKGAVAVVAALAEKGVTATIRSSVNLEPVQHALHNTKSMIQNAVAAVGGNEEDVMICLSGPTNFRADIATIKVYKGNRDPDHKPTHGPAILDYMSRHWPTITSDYEEADDMMGYMQYAIWKDDPYGSVIVSIDKDMDMIPGLHYNFMPGKERLYFVDDRMADTYFWFQLVTGDSTDNIQGVKGAGPAKAAAIFDECYENADYYKAARALYIQGYEENPREALIENARLIWIRRHEEEIWTPQLMNVD